MRVDYWKNIVRFVFLILLQGLVLEHIHLPGNLHLMVYPIALLLLPIQTPVPAVLLLGFVSGFSVDLLGGMPGLNAAAATLLCFVRIIYFRIRNQRDVLRDNDFSGTPLPDNLGWGGFSAYALWLIILFHLGYFLLDAFSLRHFFYTLYLTVGSSFLCFLALLLTVSLFRPKAGSR